MSSNNKVALVTGAASGIGQAVAERLGAEGFSVVVTDINVSQGQAVTKRIVEANGTAIFAPLDATSEDAWAEVVARVKEEYGALHVLVNNAGIGLPDPITEMSFDKWRLQFALNVDAAFLGMKHAIPVMAESGGGSIINLSSEAGINPWENMSAYCASKAAVKMLTKVAALECALARNGVRVNSLHPGVVQTPAWGELDLITDDKHSDVGSPELVDFAKSVVPLGYHAVPDDLAEAVLFLASDASHYMTGSELVMDGGMSIAPPSRA